jgi:hypothetical protein
MKKYMKPYASHLLPGLPTGATKEAPRPDFPAQDQRPCSIAPLQLARKIETDAAPSSGKSSRTENVRKWLSRRFSPEDREIIAQALAEAWTT